MAKDDHRMGNGILGDIDPAPEPESPNSGQPIRNGEKDPSSMSGESKQDRTQSDRDVEGRKSKVQSQ